MSGGGGGGGNRSLPPPVSGHRRPRPSSGRAVRAAIADGVRVRRGSSAAGDVTPTSPLRARCHWPRVPPFRPAGRPPPVPDARFHIWDRDGSSFIKRRYTSPRRAVWAVRSFSVHGRRIRHTRRARLQFNKSTGASITCVCVTVCVSVLPAIISIPRYCNYLFIYLIYFFFFVLFQLTCGLECARAPPYIFANGRTYRRIIYGIGI